jgi:hypothetical protein
VKTLALRLEERQYERLRLMAFEERRPMAEIVRAAVQEYLEQRPIPPGQEWFWSAAWQKAEKEAESDLAAGRYETFDTMEDFLAGLE